MSICILVPSRGRPERAKAMVESIHATAAEYVHVVLIVDQDDPTVPEYMDRLVSVYGNGNDIADMEILPERLGYTGSLNALTRGDLVRSGKEGPPPPLWDVFDILGAFGDDVLFRTKGWDQLIENALDTPGIAFGNDLVHASGHPTAIFMSSVIAKALGYIAIPQSRHLWVDDAWKDLGTRTGTLRYVPEAIFEHMHPAVQKAEMDQTYREVYDSELGHKDHLGFLDWQANHAEADAAKVRAVA